MVHSELILIERINGVSLYGRKIDAKGKLGQYEVHSDVLGNNGQTYTMFSEAKNRMNALIGVHKK